MEAYETRVSVIEPLGPAIDHVKQVLFRPFDLERWLALGFCAWLATLGSGGGGGGGNGVKWEQRVGDPKEAFHRAQEYVMANLAWIVPLFFLGMTLVAAIWILFTWLSSRGRFMFLHNVIHNTTEVRRPWSQFREYAHSLFLFRLVLDVVGMLAGAVIVGGGAFLVFTLWQTAGASALWILVVLVPLLAIVSLGFIAIKVLTHDFVLPVMLLRSTYCVPAWQDFNLLLFPRPGRFVLYLLFKFAIGLAIGVIVFFLAVLSCGCACCIMSLPYIGTVLLLPVHVFTRAYSLHYLRQYGPAYDVYGPVSRPASENDIPATE